MTPAQRAATLRADIRRHEHAYYVLDAPEIADAEFDALLKELQALEAAHPELVTPDSPTQRVGGAILEGLPTARHRVPMLSLDNAYDEADARAFDERLRRALGAGDEALPYVAELKIDGLSMALTYDAAGALVRGVTRGDGVEGEDVTPNVRTIRALPLTLAGGGPGRTIEVRGEVFLPRASFARINREREEAEEPLFANARNAAAGTMRTLDPKLVAARGLGAFVYQLVDAEAAPEQCLPTHSATLEAFARWSLPVETHWRRCDGIDAVLDFCREWIDARHGLPFETDGVVIKLDDIARREKAGSTSKFPRWAFAYKFPAQQATTKLKAILVNVGRTGAVTPYADLEPVFLAGSTISQGDAAQRPGSRAQGHPRRRLRPDREGRRRHPEGRDVAAAAAADRRRRAAAVGDADRRARSAGRRWCAAKRKRSGAARTRAVRPACAAASSTSPRGGR